MKKAIFTLQNGGGSYKITIKNRKNPDGWNTVDGEIIYDYQVKAIKTDMENDGYKVETIGD